MDDFVRPREPEQDSPAQTTDHRGGTGAFWVILLLIAFFGIGWWLWTHRPASAPQLNRYGAKNAAQPVGVATIGTGDIRVVLNELGTVTPLDTVTVQTQINGLLMGVGFTEGQLVQKGAFLAQIDDRPYQANLQKDQGTLAHDQGLLAQARSDLLRFETLGRQDSIAIQQVVDQRYLVQQDAGTVASDQGRVATDKLDIDYCHITAPVTGRVGLRQVDPGNYVQTTSTTGIAVLTQLQPISVIFSLPQTDLSAVEARLVQGATLPVDAYDQSNTKKIDSGTLGTVDNEMDTSTGTVKIRAIFPNTKYELFPNQFVNAHLLVNTLTDVVRVPTEAVQIGAPGSFVWVVNDDDTVSSRTVAVGPTDGSYEQVLSGLQPGDRVVTDGTDRLRDGLKVSIPAPASATPSAAGDASGGGWSGNGGSAAVHQHHHGGHHHRPTRSDRPPEAAAAGQQSE
jgi:membrane fusion protein, multidrug efflux system